MMDIQGNENYVYVEIHHVKRRNRIQTLCELFGPNCMFTIHVLSVEICIYTV